MKGLAILIILILKTANCQWMQDGLWTQQTLSNTSFLFTFFGTDEGQAKIKGFTSGPIINLRLQNIPKGEILDVRLNSILKDKEIDKIIILRINLTKEEYETDPVFIAQKSVRCHFNTKNGSDSEYQEMRKHNMTVFNISFTHRKWLELRSSEGVFRVKLIDIEQISPNIFYYLWLILILVFMVCQAYFYLLKKWDMSQIILPTLGSWSNELIMWWISRYLWNFFYQSYYLSDTFGSSLLAFCSCLIMEILIMEITLRVDIKNPPKAHLIFSSIVIATGILMYLWKEIIPGNLWYYLPFIIAYEIVTIFYAKQEDTENKLLKIILLMLIYVFPCFIFPWFSFEMQYPQEEAELWWLYGVFYLVEVAVFLLKAFRGVFKLRRLIRLKRLIKLKAQKRFNSSAYLELQEKACPLCLKEVVTSEIGMSPAGEAAQVDWIQAQCNHHFHKACVRQSMQEIDCCLFDKTLWTDEFKKSAQE